MSKTEADQLFEAVKDCDCYEDAVTDLADQYEDTEGFVAVVAIAFGVSEDDVWAKVRSWHDTGPQPEWGEHLYCE